MVTSKIQNKVNGYLLENPVKNAQNLLDIEKCLSNDGLYLPENISIHSQGIGSINFIKWYEALIKTSELSEYPKTYDDCCPIVGVTQDGFCNGHRDLLLEELQKLLICRDAYWELLKWTFDIKYCYDNDIEVAYICRGIEGIELQEGLLGSSAILTFPTYEACRTFYNNFKGLIEKCKELL